MAVKLQANYSKKIGLPQYSSHSFMASVEVELTDLSQVENECQRLYSVLQQAVDSELQQVGYLPADSTVPSKPTASRHSHENRENKVTNPRNQNPDQWSCTDGQRTFITKLIEELLSKVGKPREQRWSSPDNRSSNSNGHQTRRPANSNHNRRMEAVA